MKVFISWSGDGKIVADALCTFLIDTINVRPFLSSEMLPGTRWRERVAKELDSTDIGIVCVTYDAMCSPWVLFEAGALSKRVEESRLIPFLIPTDEKQIDGPLGGFQHVAATRAGSEALLNTINRAMPTGKEQPDLDRAFNNYWPDLEKAIMRAQSTARKMLPVECSMGQKCFADAISDRLDPKLKVATQAFIRLRAEQKAQELGPQGYADRASVLRRLEKRSIHLLYATWDAVLHYYSRVNENWVNDEQPLPDKKMRRRLIIVEARHKDDHVYRQHLGRIAAKFDLTSDLNIIDDQDLVPSCRGVLRDFGIFEYEKDGVSGRAGLATFVQLNDKIFAQSPGSFFEIRDEGYLDEVQRLAEDAWNHPDHEFAFHRGRQTVIGWGHARDNVAYEWAVSESVLSPNALESLVANRIPAIRIERFATEAECMAFAEAARSISQPATYQNVPEIKIIGTPLFDFKGLNNDLQPYFTAAQQSLAEYARIVEKAGGFDPVKRFRDLVGKSMRSPVALAHEPDDRLYFAGLIRFIDEGAGCHVDDSGSDVPNCTVARADYQIAWNLFLAAPRRGGDCTVYEMSWSRALESFHRPDDYAYDPAVTQGARCFTITPRVGDIVIFNCRNFHRVERSFGNRITIGSFLGKVDDELLLWS